MKPLVASLSLLVLAALPLPAGAAEPPAGAMTAPAPEEAPSATDPEQAVVSELRAMRLEGEVVALTAENKEVFGLFMPAQGGERLGGIVLLHDLNGHADSLGVIHSLRTGLPASGWSTLSVQLPHSEDGAVTTTLLDAIQPRIGAAIAELQRRGSNAIVLTGHGLGARAAVDYLAAGDNLSVQALVLVSMDGVEREDPRLDAASQLTKLRPPILDIYGGRDQEAVIDSAARRASAGQGRQGAGAGAPRRYSDIARDYTEEKGSKLGYRQLRIAGADHNYTHQEASLVRHVRGWLGRHLAETE